MNHIYELNITRDVCRRLPSLLRNAALTVSLKTTPLPRRKRGTVFKKHNNKTSLHIETVVLW